MGEFQVPAAAYYGAQTARAVDNFPVSGLRFPRSFIRALGAIKGAAAEVNRDLGLAVDADLSAGLIDEAEARIRAAVPIARVIYLEPDIDRG